MIENGTTCKHCSIFTRATKTQHSTTHFRHSLVQLKTLSPSPLSSLFTNQPKQWLTVEIVAVVAVVALDVVAAVAVVVDAAVDADVDADVVRIRSGCPSPSSAVS